MRSTLAWLVLPVLAAIAPFSLQAMPREFPCGGFGTIDQNLSKLQDKYASLETLLTQSPFPFHEAAVRDFAFEAAKLMPVSSKARTDFIKALHPILDGKIDLDQDPRTFAFQVLEESNKNKLLGKNNQGTYPMIEALKNHHFNESASPLPALEPGQRKQIEEVLSRPIVANADGVPISDPSVRALTKMLAPLLPKSPEQRLALVRQAFGDEIAMRIDHYNSSENVFVTSGLLNTLAAHRKLGPQNDGSIPILKMFKDSDRHL